MTAEGEIVSDLSLGVLADQFSVGAESRVDRAMAVLGELGLSKPNPVLRNAVGVALVHTTYLYENRSQLPGVTRGLLDALRSLGQTFLERLAAIDAYRATATPTAGSMTAEVFQVGNCFSDWAMAQAWLVESAALGRAFVGDVTPPARVWADLCRQLVGVLCLADEQEVAAGLLKALLSDARLSIHDPKKVLQTSLAGHNPAYTYEREGPDHEAVFRATVTDARSRRGVGVGRSKKDASREAALDFLRRHVPQALAAGRATRASPPAPIALPRPRAHALMVRRLWDLFALSVRADGLLSQALIHSSWAFENRAMMTKFRQQDNRSLAFIGSAAAIYEHSLNAAQQAVAESPEEYAFRNLDNDPYSHMFQQAGLASGLLLGAGQAMQGVSVEMAAGAFQAMFGAVFIATGFPDSLASHWPPAWASIWHAIAPAESRRTDPTTLLEQTTSAMRLRVERSFRRSGPDHACVYQVTTVLDSETLGARIEVTGVPSTSKTRAKHNGSSAVLQVLERLARPSFEQDLAGASTEGRALARFLLTHEAAVLVTSSVVPQSWIKHRLFGLHLAAHPEQLLTWARDADRLLDSQTTMSGANPRLQEVFRAVLDAPARPGEVLDKRLAQTLTTLEELATPEQLSREHLDDLVQLCNVYRCLGADDPGGHLSVLVADSQLLYRGRLTTNDALPDVWITGREWNVLNAAVATMLVHKATAEVVVVKPAESLRLHVRTVTGPPPARVAIERTCGLWSVVSATAVLSPVEDGIEATLKATTVPTELAPIATAVVAATRPEPEPYRAAMADLLHDVKNQLVAARQAAASPAVNETVRLEQQLAARRHLEKAQVIAFRLRAAASLLEPASGGTVSVELGSFLRHFATSAFGWLPQNIALAVPDAGRVAHVAIDERALSAVLDNLMRNAADAMRDGGAIGLEWAADQYEAVIELTDNGPGLPAEVVHALESGRRVRSTKAGGNGLGLLSVQTLLKRAGGQLSVAPSTSGTAWLITLPIAATPTSEDL